MQGLALLTDLYELTMAAVYHDQGMFEPGTFSLFVRDYPAHRRYFVSAGLEDVLHYLQDLRFSADDLSYLERLRLFKPEFLAFLEKFRFRGEVFAIPEGRLFFANEPILEITAPLIESQIIETFVINAINLQVMIATKASRCCHAAGRRELVDFSLRRTHGINAGMKVARASYIGGFFGTSNVLAGKTYGLPVLGTMAHSYITSFGEEADAFRAFARTFPENTVLLVDTYDTIRGTVCAAEIGRVMALEGKSLKGIRLDSGDIPRLSRGARKILDRAGLRETEIVASGNFDEYKIERVLRRGGVIDSFGVGTRMGVSSDAPYLDIAYKLVDYSGRPVLKLSPGKATLAGKKQVFRISGARGKLSRDVIGLRDDPPGKGESLLQKVMSCGRSQVDAPPLAQIRARFLEEFANLPEKLKSVVPKRGDVYPVGLSPRLRKLQTQVIQKIKENRS